MSTAIKEPKQEATHVTNVEIDLEDILGTGAASVMTSGESEPKKTIFSPPTADLSFLDKPAEEPKTPVVEGAEGTEGDEAVVVDPVDPADPVDPVDGIDPLAQPAVELEEGTEGTPVITEMATVAKQLIEKGIILPFEDDKKIEDYTSEDYEELFEMNIAENKKKLEAEIPEQFFNSLPPEMQQAYSYIANGGTDMKSMFSALSASQEMKEIDISKEDGQKHAIRSYLTATSYGTPEEIEDEIFSYEDRNELEKKATQFKPKLDAMQEQVVQQKVKSQKESNDKRAKQSKGYMDSMYTILEKGKLGDLELDPKTQDMLYAGLVQSNYPSISGKGTNMLGHLLEKYQWVEPNHTLVAEALYLLADPEGYKKNLGAGIKEEVNKETMRTLKTEQANKTGSSSTPDEVETPEKGRRPAVPRANRSIFKRN